MSLIDSVNIGHIIQEDLHYKWGTGLSLTNVVLAEYRPGTAQRQLHLENAL
jgi:hypothetical protein